MWNKLCLLDELSAIIIDEEELAQLEEETLPKYVLLLKSRLSLIYFTWK